MDYIVKKSAIIQARVNSERLPQKIFYNLPFDSNITVIEQIIKRSKKIPNINDVIIATTDVSDDRLAKIAKAEEVEMFKGNEHNVLNRFYCAAKENGTDIIVRITGDNPCIDPLLIGTVLESHIRNEADYTKTEGYPIGLNVEVFNFNALEKAHDNATEDYEKEHVTPYIDRNPQIFKTNILKALQELYTPDIRITLDTEEDYALLCTVFDYLYPKDKYFTTYDIVNLFKEKPWLKLINKKILQKKILTTLEEELEEAKKLLELQGLRKASEILERTGQNGKN